MPRLISFRGAFEAVCVVPSPSLSLPSSPMLTSQHLPLCPHLYHPSTILAIWKFEREVAPPVLSTRTMLLGEA